MSTFFVGAYTKDMRGDAEGIAVLRSRDDGSLENIGVAASIDSPSYLVADDTHLYAVSEGASRVERFARDGQKLTAIDGDAAGGSYPCHLALYGETLITSCFGDGTLGVLGIDPVRLTGTLVEEGSGPRAEQDGAHAHGTYSPDGSLVLSADLGADRINVYGLENGVLAKTGSIELPPGTGPRDFRAGAGVLYLLGELSLEVLVLTPQLELIGSTPIPGAFEGDHAAGLTLSDDGRFAFVGLRGSNLIATLAVAPNGQLSAVTSTPCGGDWPRHHLVDGEYVHVANERSNTVATFRIGDDGSLTLVAEPTPVASPTFLLRADLEPAQTLLK